MKKQSLFWLLLVLVVLVGGGYFIGPHVRGILPALRAPYLDIATLLPRSGQSDSPANPDTVPVSDVGFPLQLPKGVRIEVWADHVPGARVLVQDGHGNYWVSQTGQGIVSRLDVQEGNIVGAYPIFQGLNNPHGLAIDPKEPLLLYVAEEDKISRVALYSEASLEKIADLPAGSGHATRTLGFGPDGRLYVSVGSSCNVCNESDSRRSKIFSMRSDGSDLREVARGLRNAVFFTWSPTDARLWATEMGRDLLGDNLPPDELNVITEESHDYGWPYCYGKNVRDEKFAGVVRCEEPAFMSSAVDLPAHSAPLGLAFLPTSGWPKEWQHDLIVAYHGSWNRTTPTGYKLVRVKLSSAGTFEGIEDFITGWLTPRGEVLGRPVAVRAEDNGALYVTDDKAGVIYKITYAQ